MRHNTLILAVAIAATGILNACAGGGGNPIAPYKPPVVTPPVPVVVSYYIAGDANAVAGTVVAGTTPQFHYFQKWSNDSVVDVSSFTRWGTTAYAVADVTPSGIVIPANLGTLQVTASYAGVTDSLPVRIVGTPWSQAFPALSADQKAWVKAFVLNLDGVLYRWGVPSVPITTIKVWAQAGVPTQNLQAADDEIRLQSNGSVNYVVAADSASAQVWIVYDPSTVQLDPCGWGGGYSVDFTTHTITRGLVRLRPSSANECADKVVLAHELLHVLNLMGHTTPGTDLLSPAGVWQTTANLGVLISVVSSTVSGGTILIDP